MKKSVILGAGFSYDLGMPLTTELTDVFLGIFTKRKAKIFAERLALNKPYTEDRPINKKAIFEAIDLVLDYKKSNGNNYEELLSELQNLGNQPSKSQSDRDSYHYLFGIYYEIIHQILTLFQLESYQQIYSKNHQWFSGLKNILSKNDETWAFTLNHDLYLECLAIDLNIPITFGDSNFISFPIDNLNMKDQIQFSYSNRDSITYDSEGFIRNKFGINLVKLHGGLSELHYKDKKLICNQILKIPSSHHLIENFKKIDRMAHYANGQRIPSGRDRVITNSDGELDIICKSMLTGGNKYSLTTNVKAGEEKLQLMDKALEEAEEVTIIGYGFGDKHVNYRISNAMVRNASLKLRIVDPISKPKPEFLQQFDYDLRLRGATCGAPHWMDYSNTEKWNKDQIDNLKRNESIRGKIKSKVESYVQ